MTIISHRKYSKGDLAILHHRLDAQRPTIVFLHDALGSIETWKDFPRQLCQRCQCNLFAYDRLGHGQSSRDPKMVSRPKEFLEVSAEILIELLRDYQIRHPILVGHSDGGTIALLAAAMEGNTICGVISIAGHIYVEPKTIKGIRAVQKNYEVGNIYHKLEPYHGIKTIDVFQSWTNSWLSPEFQSWNISEHLVKIGIPTLVIQGEKDEFATLQQAKDIVAGIGKTAELMILPECGHFPHKEYSDQVLKTILAFINNRIKWVL